MSATLRDDLVHLLEVELAAGHVELVDLVRHPADLVPQPAELAGPAAVPVLLVRRHLGRDVVLERRARDLLAVLELLLDLGVDAVEDPLHVRLGGVEDRLDLRGDLGPPLLVLRLRLALVRDQLGQRGALGALHAGDALLGLGVGVGLALLDDLLLLLAVLPRRLVRVRRRPPSCRRGACSNCGSLDSASCSSVTSPSAISLVDLVLAGLEVDLLRRRRLGHRTGGRDRHRRAGLLGGHRRDRLRHRLRLVRRRLGGRLDVLGLALLALGDQSLDLALDLAGLARLLVVVGLLQRLRATSPRWPPSPRR